MSFTVDMFVCVREIFKIVSLNIIDQKVKIKKILKIISFTEEEKYNYNIFFEIFEHTSRNSNILDLSSRLFVPEFTKLLIIRYKSFKPLLEYLQCISLAHTKDDLVFLAYYGFNNIHEVIRQIDLNKINTLINIINHVRELNYYHIKINDICVPIHPEFQLTSMNMISQIINRMINKQFVGFLSI